MDLSRSDFTTITLGSTVSVGGDIKFRISDTLTSIDLGSLQELGGVMDVSELQNLEAFDMGQLTVLEQDLEVNSPKLTSVDLGALTRVNGSITLYRSLFSMFTTQQLERVDRDVRIWRCDSLLSIDLSGLQTLGGDLSLQYLPRREAVILGNLATLPHNVKVHSAALKRVDFGQLTRVEGDISFSIVTKLTTLDLQRIEYLTTVDFNHLRTVGGRVDLSSLSRLEELRMGKLAALSRGLSVANAQLTHMDFGELTHVSGNVDLSNNRLTTIERGRLEVITGNLDVRGNPLSSFDSDVWNTIVQGQVFM
ncbi:hypothetical protein PTSG_02967 [Salpingoeca rosetta]|uniref:Receptor L-domain domain-containing protein n=1 Tax=Salpingoeca rosetta (strain ATCC 50818 / BSB-021) TaxID=946362 RepID=F2U3V5_SALR5|nr:uncharacterized protein PTSG_02967 [Salpingoeca rosetta]EGD82299.1 hypothetical protein PTSG_02967 [Salpingoeca rosetta]|eukprot:XP_004996482.1 hypothetical protein PTSG_02967 [Salpingoeca rosetta]